LLRTPAAADAVLCALRAPRLALLDATDETVLPPPLLPGRLPALLGLGLPAGLAGALLPVGKRKPAASQASAMPAPGA
jgi:hypothetical protein